MSLQKFTLRGGDDWLLFAQSNDPDDDRAYVAVTECWPVWLDVEKRFGDGQWGGPRTSLRNPDVLEMVAAEADDRDFGIPRWSVCDACGEPYRFAGQKGIDTRCGCPTRDEEAA